MNVIAASRPWFAGMAERLRVRTGEEFRFLGAKDDLTLEKLDAWKPRYVFFPHWSYIIPAAIHQAHECVIFHMTDLPFGRGGSPLQNLIARGIYETRISALRCSEGLDTGPIYLKKPLSLEGAARDIYLRAAAIIEEMMVEILSTHPVPVPQSGQPVAFARRKPEEGNLAPLSELRQVYDFIRMLDADGYPPAFLETEHFRLEFSRASLQTDNVVADVRIIKK